MKSEYLMRSIALFGKERIDKLSRSSVAIFGLGGVGGAALEALARSGIGYFHLVDFADIKPSNMNRQLLATSNTIGQSKLSAAKDRIQKINPDVTVFIHPIFYEKNSYFNFDGIDFVVDAIDTISSKLWLIEECKQHDIPIISCMGTGNKTRPELLEISDISKTSVCPLARVVRKELKRKGITKLDVVYSKELPKKVVIKEKNSTKNFPASSSVVPPVAGFLMASFVLRKMMDERDERNE